MYNDICWALAPSVTSLGQIIYTIRSIASKSLTPTEIPNYKTQRDLTKNPSYLSTPSIHKEPR